MEGLQCADGVPMLKIVGSVLIILSGVGIAWSIRDELAEHIRLLYEVRKLLLDISYAASSTRQPVEILLGCFIDMKDERLHIICKEIAERLIEKKEGAGEEVWRSVFRDHQKNLRLTREESEVIESAGSAFFGKSMEENRKYLALVLERLDYLIETARGEQKEKQKVYGTISVVCGVMVVILLV